MLVDVSKDKSKGTTHVKISSTVILLIALLPSAILIGIDRRPLIDIFGGGLISVGILLLIVVVMFLTSGKEEYKED